MLLSFARSACYFLLVMFAVVFALGYCSALLCSLVVSVLGVDRVGFVYMSLYVVKFTAVLFVLNSPLMLALALCLLLCCCLLFSSFPFAF